MSNPFDSMKLKHWPDFILAVSGITFLMSFGAMASENNLPGGVLGWVSLTGSIFLFGVAGKIAFKRVFNKESKKWEDGWRNNLLSNIFLFFTLCVGVFSLYVFAKIS